MKHVLTTILIISLISMSILTFKVRTVQTSGTIYIRANGSIDPPTASISTSDNVTYTFSGNIYDSIVVERDNIVIDGAGYTLQKTGDRTGVGIELSGRRNVKVTNTTIRSFNFGIRSSSLTPFSSNNSIVGNNIIDNRNGIHLEGSSNNSITGNVFIGDGLVAIDSYGMFVEDNLVNGKPLVYLEGVSNHVVEDAGQVILLKCNNIRIENLNLSRTDDAIQLGGTNNTIMMNNRITANNEYGILLYSSSNNNSIVGNNIANTYFGMWIETFSNDNSIVGNNIVNNSHGIFLGGGSLNNLIFHNNFMNNTQQIADGFPNPNFWDYGYPSGGNYWSDYSGVDSNHDGIGDTVHAIAGNNTDRYPLMGMFSDFNVTLDHHIQTICNSTISEFHFNGTATSFNITGENGPTGFCRICIPTALMNTPYMVSVNRTEVTYTLSPFSNSTHSYLYFTYTHSIDRSSSVLITVRDTTPPTANAGQNQTTLEGTTVTLDASKSDDNVAIVQYSWDLGDGTSQTGLAINHTYSNPGLYIVTLTVTDAAGNNDTDTIAVNVRARGVITLTPSTGLASTTIAGSGFSNNSRIAISWDGATIPTIPNGVATDVNGSFTALISVPTQTVPGAHTVIATDETGNWNTATFTVTDMAGPQGPKGDTGQRGSQGPEGPQGPSANMQDLLILVALPITLAVLAICLATVALLRKRGRS